jgi:hypothetical protein
MTTKKSGGDSDSEGDGRFSSELTTEKGNGDSNRNDNRDNRRFPSGMTNKKSNGDGDGDADSLWG